jgi:hypothetical protein
MEREIRGNKVLALWRGRRPRDGEEKEGGQL